MTQDEEAITRVIDRWMESTRNGDLEAVLDLMAEDAVFGIRSRAL